MAKGWSFGALADALKSAAFLDAGTQPGAVVLNSTQQSGAAIDAGAGVDWSFKINRAVAGGTTVSQLISTTGGTVGQITNGLNLSWYSDNAQFGIVRGGGQDVTSVRVTINNVARLDINKSSLVGIVGYADTLAVVSPSNRPVLRLRNNAGADIVSLSSDGSTGALISLANKNWNFNANGTLLAPIPDSNGGAGAGIRVAPPAGGFIDWQSRATGLLIDTNVAVGATSIFKATEWGSEHLAGLDVYRDSSGTKTLLLHVGAAEFSFSSSTIGFTCNRIGVGTLNADNITSSSSIVTNRTGINMSLTGGISLVGDGNRLISFQTNANYESALIYADSSHRLHLRCTNAAYEWMIDSSGIGAPSGARLGYDGTVYGSKYGASGYLDAWVRDHFVTGLRMTGQGTMIIDGNTNQICPAGGVLVGYHTEGSNPGGDTLFWTNLQYQLGNNSWFQIGRDW